MGLLVLVRHGESRWNQEKRFTGWVDVPLSAAGVIEATVCARHCTRYQFTKAFTSRLERAHETLHINLAHQHRTGIVQHHASASPYRAWIEASNIVTNHDIPVVQDERLNERYYGKLQGMKKKDAEKKFGKDRVRDWRRGFHAVPPGGESLAMTFDRVIPYFRRTILPVVKRRETVLLVAHGNTLRAIIKSLEGISDDAIVGIDLPQAKPIVYEHRAGKFTRVSGEYRYNRPLR
jgi:2,3-bisphosphoglycerate-dependent phosphoglycerate mutase